LLSGGDLESGEALQRRDLLHDADDHSPGGAHLATEQLFHGRDGSRSVGKDLAPQQVASDHTHHTVAELLLVEQYTFIVAQPAVQGWIKLGEDVASVGGSGHGKARPFEVELVICMEIVSRGE
jgi:hypothetical protein